MNTDLNTIAHIAGLLNEPGKKIAVISHLNPDGDALGSSLGLQNLFLKMGHQCNTISPNDYPEFLRWLPGNETIVVFWHFRKQALDLIKDADIIFAIDFNELKRVQELKEAFEAASAYKLLIDHHPEPSIPVDFMLSETTASSTAELVYRFIKDAGFVHLVDKDIATCLFTGIMTDTGCFSYNSSGRETWKTVADLLGYGINKDEIYSLTYDNYSEHRMRLLGYCLNEKMEVYPGFRTGFIALSKEDLAKFHFEAGDSEGFVNYPLSIKGINVSALFIEKDDRIRISFRSKGKFAVNELAKKHFNGGGHKNAAGGESYLTLNETIVHFKEVLDQYKDKLTENEN
jgi:phosphoesterase RecJ-like protein